jgi:Transposase domain (DUF772)
MRGPKEQQDSLFGYVSAEKQVPGDHRLRRVRAMSDRALEEWKEKFRALYAPPGRRSIAPEKLLRALRLQALYSVRSERLWMEQLEYKLWFRWYVGVKREITVGADQAYPQKDFIEGLRKLNVVPHLAEYARSVEQGPNGLTAGEREHPGFLIRQAQRKRIERHLGWRQTIGGMRKTKYRGGRRVGWMFSLAAAASNLIPMAKPMPDPA